MSKYMVLSIVMVFMIAANAFALCFAWVNYYIGSADIIPMFIFIVLIGWAILIIVECQRLERDSKGGS